MSILVYQLSETRVSRVTVTNSLKANNIELQYYVNNINFDFLEVLKKSSRTESALVYTVNFTLQYILRWIGTRIIFTAEYSTVLWLVWRKKVQAQICSLHIIILYIIILLYAAAGEHDGDEHRYSIEKENVYLPYVVRTRVIYLGARTYWIKVPATRSRSQGNDWGQSDMLTGVCSLHRTIFWSCLSSLSINKHLFSSIVLAHAY